MAKHLCDCGKIALYCYMPASDNRFNPYVCDDCISSVADEGCSCNWHYTNVNAYHPPLDNPELPEGEEGKDWRWVPNHKDQGAWQYLDDKGRPYPCCEYDFNEQGYDIEVKLYLTDEQKEWIKDFSQEHCDIHFKNGLIIEKELITDKSYFWILEELGLTNGDIIKIIKNEKTS